MFLKILKLEIGAVLGILGAYYIGLSNPLTAGIIVLLSIGRTKKSSLQVAGERTKAVVLSFALSAIVYRMFGFTVFSFGIFLFGYIPLAAGFKIESGLIIGAVLSTHFVSAAVLDLGIFLNTAGLYVIGITVALAINAYTPDVLEKIKSDQGYIESCFRAILLEMAGVLRKKPLGKNTELSHVGAFIEEALARARDFEDNHVFADKSYNSKYIHLRKMQFEAIRRMHQLACGITMDIEQVLVVAALTEELARELSESNTGSMLLGRLSAVMGEFQKGELPRNREEFENRAVLFQYLSELRYLIELKREFSNEYVNHY